VFSATYLKLSSTRPAQQKFRDLMRPMEETLQHAEGLVGYRVATSSDCVTARTLSVWKDEQAMKRFVYSPAHGKAIAAISELSRGGSVTTRWEGESADFSLETAARKLSAAPPLD
jgi:quinol monooxygenase YgiN